MRSKGRACDDVRDYYPALKRWGVTPREAEVARLVAAGYTNEEVGDELGISLSTTKVHVASLLHRLGVRTRRVLIGEVCRIAREYREERERQERTEAADLRLVLRKGGPSRRSGNHKGCLRPPGPDRTL